MNKLIKIVGKEMEYVKSYERLGYSREEATKIVLLLRAILSLQQKSKS